MATAAEELNPPDLLSSVSIDPSLNSGRDQNTDDGQAADISIKDADLLYQINNLHCPFIWKPEDSLRSFNHSSVEEIMNVDEVFDEASGFKLRKFVIHLIQCYNSFGKRLLEKSLKHLDEMEKMLLNSMKNRSQDVYFTQINDALFHILHSCRVVMLHTTNQKEKAQQVLQKITPYDNLNPTNQAGIWAVRANLYVEFGYDGIKAAIQYIERSTKIESTNPYWHFTRGMYLGRLRRIESGLAIPSMDEIASLELAMKLKEDASFMAFAAEVYVETASRSKKKSQQLLLIANETERQKLAEKNDLINERAAMLFKKSVSLNKNCAHLLFRCGKGLLKLVPPHQDVRLAHEYLKQGLEISYDSSFGNHAMALYYMKHEQDYDTAKRYLIKAAQSKNFGADIDLIRVNFLVNQDSEELLDSLLKLFDRYDDKIKHRKILAEIESYYLFINYNLKEAINYMNKLLYLIGDHDDIISVFKSGILRQKLPVSLLEILLSDITDRSNKGTLNAEEQEECRQFMHRLCFQNVNLPRPKNENLRKKLVKEIKANFKEIDVSKVKRPAPHATEKLPRKDYNAVEGRFDKEYAKKYYAEDESSKSQKTVVDEFFEKYEAAVDSKSNVVAESSNRNRDNTSGHVETKTKDTNEFHPVLQQLFNKVKELPKKVDSSDELSENDETEGIINRLARKLDLHLSVSARAEISQKLSRTRNIKEGASASRQRDNFDAPDVYRRRSSRSPRKRSRSRERPDSRESHHLTKESYRKRSPSIESRYSTRHSHRRRSTSRENTRRSTSRDQRRSQKRRSVSRESYVSSRSGKIPLRKRSESREDRRSPRRRSLSRESKYSVRSSRRRSPSQEIKEDRDPSRKRSQSRESKYSIKSSHKRSPSQETKEDRNSSKKRSLSRESKYSVRSSRKRSPSQEVKDGRNSSERRSLSRESKYSVKSNRRRSPSQELKKDRNSSKRRSLSRDSKLSVRSSRRTSLSRERRSTSKNERRSRRERSSKEGRKRSPSRENVRSTKESTHKRRSPSRDGSKSPRRKERSVSNESHRSSKSKYSRRERSSSEKRHNRRSPVNDSDSKTISMDSDKSLPAKERSRSRESPRSSKHSPRPERKKQSGRSKKYESDDTLTEFSDSDTDYKRNKSEKYRKNRYEDDRRDYRRKDLRRSYSSDETRSIRSKRSSSKDHRSKRISSRDRRDDHGRKQYVTKYSSSEESSSDSSPRSSRRKTIKLPKSSCDVVSGNKVDSKKDQKKSENQEADDKVTSDRSRSDEKRGDENQNNESDPKNGA